VINARFAMSREDAIDAGGSEAESTDALEMNVGKRLRVCHLGKFYPPAPGGIESHVRTLAQAQTELGAEVEVVCVNHATSSGEDVTWRALGRSSTLEEWDGHVRVTRLGRLAGFSRLELCPALVTLVGRACRRSDIVHVHAPNVTMYLALLTLRLDVPLIVTHHSDVVKQRHLGRVFAPVERVILGRAAQVFSCSAPYVRGSRALSALEAKLRILPLGIDLEPFQEPSARARSFADELLRQHGAPLWLSVGRLIYYKGLDVALQALQQVPGKLLVIGRGPMESELKELARRRGVADRVVWFDYLDSTRLVGAYLAARALWFPSIARSEGFGLVQVEAMASGCPVLNTSIPDSGVAWVSLDGVSGLTTAPGDARALALAARRLLEDPELSGRLARGGRQRAQTEFSAALMARRSLDFYAGVSSGIRAA
jgi:rhamnosyl/mannosyltransferase